MKKTNDPFAGAFDNFENTAPTERQKQKMLSFVLEESRRQESGFLQKLGEWIAVKPWRFAFCASALQAAAFTLMFGTRYTNLLMSIFGG